MANLDFPGRNPLIKVFGSLMTGLALETSDMDIAVTGLRIDGREDMIDDLNALGD
jgi:DNA polymerase sigma